MPLFLIIVGIVLIVSSVKNTQGTLLSLVSSDIPGYWHLALAILLAGSIGFIPRLKPVSIALLCLLMVAILETNGSNFFSKISQSIQGGTSSGASGS